MSPQKERPDCAGTQSSPETKIISKKLNQNRGSASRAPAHNDADAFRAAIFEKLGVAPKEIVVDGLIHRFSTSKAGRDDAGFYVLHDDGLPAGAFGDWRTGARFSWRAREVSDMSPEDRARLERLKADREKKQAAAYEKAARAAREQWAKAEPAREDHAYLKAKGVGAHGLRAADGVLIAPVTGDGAEIMSLQFIEPDGAKLFLPGGRVGGGYFVIGEVADVVVIVEGYATGATIFEATGLPVAVAFNAGNLEPVAKKIREKHPGARIIIAADDDVETESETGVNPGLRKAAKAAEAVGATVAAPPFDRAREGRLAGGQQATDWNDFSAIRGKQAVATAFRKICDDAEIARLVALSPIDYDRERVAVAERLGVRAPTLDKIIAGQREEAASEKAVSLVSEVEPWPEPVNVAELLDDVRQTIRRFIVCSPASAVAVALWIALSHVVDHAKFAPILYISSPQKRCGKSQLLDLVASVARRPLLASNISPAAVYRVIEAVAPTLVVDEADTFLRDNEELRGVINSGHKRSGAYVVRCVGEDFEPKRFSTWGMKAIAGIGAPSETIRDRSLMIELRRKLATEKVERLRHADPASLDEMARRLARFGADYGPDIGHAKACVPSELNDRAADNWGDLLAIADLAGGRWPAEARRAALELSGDRPDDRSTSEELLSDIRDIFDTDGCERMPMVELLRRLLEDETAPWSTWNRGKPMTPRQLSKRLSEFGITSKPLRADYTVQKGYERRQFVDAWSRYLDGGAYLCPDTPSPPVTQLQTHKNNELCVTEGVTDENSFGYMPSPVTRENVTCNRNGFDRLPSVTPLVTPNALKQNDCNCVTGGDPLYRKDIGHEPASDPAGEDWEGDL